MMFQLCETRVVKLKSTEREREREIKMGIDGNGIPVM
jgi:hypothetical protein